MNEQIVFRNFHSQPVLIERIKKRAAKLEAIFPNIVALHVVVELTGFHHHRGNLFRTRVDVSVPGEKLVVSENSRLDRSYVDPSVSIRDAFDAMERKLIEYSRWLKRVA